MNLFILRHGLAVEAESSGLMKDSDRPLTSKGERKLWKIGQALTELGLQPDLILSSPYVRARQTAEIIAEALHSKKRLELSEHLTPAGSITKLIDLINRRETPPDEVMLVGHEPYLSGLVSVLLSGHSEMRIVMKKGGLCKLSTDSLKHGACASL